MPRNGVQYPVDQRLLQKKTANALDRLDELEKALPQIVSGVNNSLQNLQRQQETVTEILDAVIEALGQETIHGIMANNRTKRAEQQAENEKKGIEEALTSGRLVVATAITEKTIIVGKETAADGGVRVPGRVQIPFVRVGEQFQAQLKDKGVGTKLDLPNGGGTFEVVEIYDVVPPPAEGAAPVAAAPEAPAAAPAAPVAAEPVAAPAETVAPTENLK